MADPLFGLTQGDRDLVNMVVKRVQASITNQAPLDLGPTIHRASDAVIVNVETPIPARPALATEPTEYDCTVWDIYSDSAEDYSVPVIDRPDIDIPIGMYHAVLDQQGNWSVIMGGDGGDEGTGGVGGTTKMVIFELTAALSPGLGGTATAEVVVTNDDLVVGATITVVSTGDWRSFTGCRGSAIKIGGQWWIVVVNQHSILWEVTLTSDTHDFSGGGVPGAISAQRSFTINAATIKTYTNYPHDYIEESPGIANPFNFIGLSGDRILIAYDDTTGQNRIIHVMPVHRRRFMVKYSEVRPLETVAPDFDATSKQALDCGPGDLPTGTFEVRDQFYRAIHGRANDLAIVEWNYELSKWMITSSEHEATEIHGTIATTFSSTPGTFQVTIINNSGNGKNPSSPVTVRNRYSWASGTAGSPIEIKWDNYVGEWVPRQMRCLT